MNPDAEPPYWFIAVNLPLAAELTTYRIIGREKAIAFARQYAPVTATVQSDYLCSVCGSVTVRRSLSLEELRDKWGSGRNPFHGEKPMFIVLGAIWGISNEAARLALPMDNFRREVFLAVERAKQIANPLPVGVNAIVGDESSGKKMSLAGQV